MLNYDILYDKVKMLLKPKYKNRRLQCLLLIKGGNDMITAKDAQMKAKQIRKDGNLGFWDKIQLFFVEGKIERASQKGEYRCSYFFELRPLVAERLKADGFFVDYFIFTFISWKHKIEG